MTEPTIKVEKITRITFAPGTYTVPGVLEFSADGEIKFEGWTFGAPAETDG